jgi:hypothetical protein
MQEAIIGARLTSRKIIERVRPSSPYLLHRGAFLEFLPTFFEAIIIIMQIHPLVCMLEIELICEKNAPARLPDNQIDLRCELIRIIIIFNRKCVFIVVYFTLYLH